MIWSISSFQTFKKCPRRWFFDEKLSHWKTKDPLRREAYILSQLESLDAWRGQIVDYVISTFIVPKLEKGQRVAQDLVIDYARKITRARYDFAQNKKYRQEEMTKTGHEEEYAALYVFEYGPNGNHSEKFKKAWEDIELALTNFLNKAEVIEELRSAERLITQRPLQLSVHGLTLKGVPDLIAFFPDEPPHIFDWKVHFAGSKSYVDQLLIYAYALSHIEPHRDFPESFAFYEYCLEEYNLTEFQLLKNTLRHYKVTDDEVERIKDWMASGMNQMECYECNLPYKNLEIENFDRTENPSDCESCPFTKICFQ